MKISELNELQRGHLAWRLDSKTSCGYIAACDVASLRRGDMDLIEVFEKYGDKSLVSAKIHARKVMNFSKKV